MHGGNPGYPMTGLTGLSGLVDCLSVSEEFYLYLSVPMLIIFVLSGNLSSFTTIYSETENTLELNEGINVSYLRDNRR